MNDFARVLLSWQPFYSTIASASATLVGLLFVSLTYNRQTLDATGHTIARETFANLLDVLLIALIFLIPHTGASSLAASLLTFGLARGVEVVKSVIVAARGRARGHEKHGVFLEAKRSLFSSLGLILLSVAIFEVNIRAMFLPVVVIVVLIASAGKNAWELLVKE